MAPPPLHPVSYSPSQSLHPRGNPSLWTWSPTYPSPPAATTLSSSSSAVSPN
jgi:hypothetical protein